jgi:hypothetical protein
MAKVSKELLSMLTWPDVAARLSAADSAAPALAAGRLGAGGGGGGIDLEQLRQLMQLREAVLLRQLAATMAAAGRDGSAVFDAWMTHQSDAVQAAAAAYAGEGMGTGHCDTGVCVWGWG